MELDKRALEKSEPCSADGDTDPVASASAPSSAPQIHLPATSEEGYDEIRRLHTETTEIVRRISAVEYVTSKICESLPTSATKTKLLVCHSLTTSDQGSFDASAIRCSADAGASTAGASTAGASTASASTAALAFAETDVRTAASEILDAFEPRVVMQ